MRKENKRGFTLIEMLLAIAITMIISGLFVSLIVAIRSSYYRTYNDVDCSDIAAMYAEALENAVLADVQNGVARDVITLNPSTGVLSNTAGTINFTAIDNFNRANGGGANRKWEIRMVCLFDDTTGEFRYRFFFVDKYVNENYLHYTYEGSFWIPNYSPFVPQIMGQGDEVSPTDTNSWDYNYRAGSYPFSISINPEAIEAPDGTLTSSSLDTINYHVRVVTDGMGELRTDSADTSTVHIPLSSSEITIITTAPA